MTSLRRRRPSHVVAAPDLHGPGLGTVLADLLFCYRSPLPAASGACRPSPDGTAPGLGINRTARLWPSDLADCHALGLLGRLLGAGGTERDLRQSISDLNHRLRYALGEYDEPPQPAAVPE
jgi:hypothetical protein